MPMRIRKIDCRFHAARRLGLNFDLPTVSLRGGFGYALKEYLLSAECYLPDAERIQCYREIFEPSGVEKTGNSGRRNAPRPFVMRGAYEDAAGKVFRLEMLLFGRATVYEPLILEALAGLARRGLGRWSTRTKLEILGIDDVHPKFPDGVFRMVVDFITPARIHAFKKRWLETVPFPALAARLADRYADLVRLYGRIPAQRDWEAWLETQALAAQSITSVRISGGQAAARRISTRTGEECRLDGFTGRMVYEGDFAPFSEILAYLPFIHVGNSASFGCGWCAVTCHSLKPAASSVQRT